CTRAGDW
nr:immunoglobulin heavy chain junction region [Mus musculus]